MREFADLNMDEYSRLIPAKNRFPARQEEQDLGRWQSMCTGWD